MSRDEGTSPSFTGRASQCQEQNSPDFLSVQVTGPYKELLSDPLLLENFSLAVLLVHMPLIFPAWDRGILCCMIFHFFLISCTLLFFKFSSYFLSLRMCLKIQKNSGLVVDLLFLPSFLHRILWQGPCTTMSPSVQKSWPSARETS